jgi:GntR family negative regulator for fad regulon and positive regulator of fabA
MPEWHAPQRPADHAEEALVTAIVEGSYPPGSTLPGERDLASQLGITRPTLREALQRLERDGWITIQQGKSTVVRDFWHEGGLNVLDTLVRYNQKLPPGFITHLLEVRLVMAPDYSRGAVEHDPQPVIDHLKGHAELEDTPEAFATFDWVLHHTLTIASGNPIYPLILNGFASFYEQMACVYFTLPQSRESSRDFYRRLLTAFEAGESQKAAQIAQEVMERSCRLWQQARQGQEGGGRAP